MMLLVPLWGCLKLLKGGAAISHNLRGRAVSNFFRDCETTKKPCEAWNKNYNIIFSHQEELGQYKT